VNVSELAWTLFESTKIEVAGDDWLNTASLPSVHPLTVVPAELVAQFVPAFQLNVVDELPEPKPAVVPLVSKKSWLPDDGTAASAIAAGTAAINNLRDRFLFDIDFDRENILCLLGIQSAGLTKSAL